MYKVLLNKITINFILYCLCGVVGVFSDLATYYCLLLFGNNYQLSNLLSYLIGTLVSFSLNARHTFKVKDKLETRLAIFIAVAAVGYLTSAMLLAVLVRTPSLDAIESKIITLPIIILIQYTLNKKITFRRKL
jgi:putative flippase GtrA